jgi:peptide/nickel transport system substrate-binding protein
VADEGARTVTFHLVRRVPDFLLILATPPFAIVPAGTPIHLGAAPIPATGPYEITDVGQASRGRDWKGARNGSLVLERNPMFHEWSSDAQPDGFADRIEVMTGVDPDEQVAMVERGKADIALDGVPADLIEGLERRASDQLMSSQYPAIGALALNTQKYPFKNQDARRAVAYALERDRLNRAFTEIAASLAGGSGSISEQPVVTCQILPPNTPGYAPYCPYTRPAEVVGEWAGPDLSHATALVDRSGTKGADVTIGMSPCLDPIAKLVADTLRDLGYQVNREIDGPGFSPADCWFGSLSPDADVSSTAWFNGYPSAAVFLVPLLSCVQPDGTPAVKGVVDYTFNASNFCEPEIDRRMQRAVNLQLTDTHASARAFESLEHDLIDLAPLIPFQTGYDAWLVSKRASNVEFNMQLLGPIISKVWVH